MSEYWSLWDWRRQVADLYGRVRASEDPAQGWELWRATRETLFRDHPQSPLDEARRGTPVAFPAYDPAWRLTAATVPLSAAAEVAPAGNDGEVHLTPFARTEGLAGALGRELTLYWIGGYGGGVFLPFKDATAGTSSYGGGRYLLDTIKGADLGWTPDGRLILDFNFAYNPSCSYSDRWICPLAPRANTLSVAIPVGERTCPEAMMEERRISA